MDDVNCSDSAAKRFVPEMLVELITRNTSHGKAGLEPSSFFLKGVCLLVDISGFTKLSGQFCEMGKNGIDELQLATNSYMEKLVQIIYTYGGEIIKFAGDAIICIFSTSFVTNVSTKGRAGELHRSMSNFGGLIADFVDGNSLKVGSGPFVPTNEPGSSRGSVKPSVVGKEVTADVVLRAMHCASVLREVQTDKLSVHVAMSCGEMCFGILGGVDNRWECLISGPCIHQLSDCLDDAPSKTAVISKDCAEILSQLAIRVAKEGIEENSPNSCWSSIYTEYGTYQYEIEPLPSGNHRIVQVVNLLTANFAEPAAQAPVKDLPNFESERLQSKIMKLLHQFVPVPLLDEVESGRELNFIAEIREVTTMFMKWDSYDAEGKHRDLLSLQSSFYAAQEVLHSTGAYLRQFLVDDKGCVLIACWGMPHMTYLDNAQRALSSAAQIRRHLNDQDLFCSFGITTGDVYCGTVGSAVRMEYAAIGSVVNMAARLMGKAQSGILIDDATYQRLPQDLKGSLLTLEPIKVKGRDEPLQVYSYASVGNMQVKEKVVEDHEIAEACAQSLLNLLKRTEEAISNEIEAAKARPKERQGSMTSFKALFSISKKENYQLSETSAPPLQILLIQGKEGSGRTTVIRWLSKQARDRRIPLHTVRVSRKDAQTDYFIWKRLFHLMTPKGLFLSNDAQRIYVKMLLGEIYSNAEVGLQTGFPVLKSVLGITCTFSNNSDGKHHRSGWLGSSKGHQTSEKHPDPRHVLDVLFRVFKYLLTVQTSIVVIEKIELCDELSLKTLMDLTKINTNSNIVLTALIKSSEPDIIASNSTFFRTPKTFRNASALNSSPWAKLNKTLSQGHKSVEVITLTDFTPEEIDRMLCATLKLPSAPEELSELVQDFSGGSFFWVREILQFIAEHGVEQFLSATEDPSNSLADSGGAFVKPALRASFSISSMNIGVLKKAPSMGVMGKARSSRQLMKTTSFRHLTNNRTVEHSHQRQLDKLVLCRFASLSPDIQRILRTASIIGMTFSSAVLSGILQVRLRDQLEHSFQTLLNQRWLYQDLDNNTVYQFAHPHSHQIIYELTPSSERSQTHGLIADHIEALYRDDKSQYGLLSFHYQQCNPDKALMYGAKATKVMLQVTSIYEFGDCVDLLTGLVKCCGAEADITQLKELILTAIAAVESYNCDVPKNFTVTLWRGIHLAYKWCTGWRARRSPVLPIDETVSEFPDSPNKKDSSGLGQESSDLLAAPENSPKPQALKHTMSTLSDQPEMTEENAARATQKSFLDSLQELLNKLE